LKRNLFSTTAAYHNHIGAFEYVPTKLLVLRFLEKKSFIRNLQPAFCVLMKFEQNL